VAPEVRVDRVVALAGGHPITACWLSDFTVPPSAEAPAPRLSRDPVAPAEPLPLITENDVRRARMRRERLRLAPGQLITPAARTLGRELKVLDEPEER
jgi:hypothetical protein